MKLFTAAFCIAHWSKVL